MPEINTPVPVTPAPGRERDVLTVNIALGALGDALDDDRAADDIIAAVRASLLRRGWLVPAHDSTVAPSADTREGHTR